MWRMDVKERRRMRGFRKMKEIAAREDNVVGTVGGFEVRISRGNEAQERKLRGVSAPWAGDKHFVFLTTVAAVASAPFPHFVLKVRAGNLLPPLELYLEYDFCTFSGAAAVEHPTYAENGWRRACTNR